MGERRWGKAGNEAVTQVFQRAPLLFRHSPDIREGTFVTTWGRIGTGNQTIKVHQIGNDVPTAAGFQGTLENDMEDSGGIFDSGTSRPRKSNSAMRLSMGSQIASISMFEGSSEVLAVRVAHKCLRPTLCKAINWTSNLVKGKVDSRNDRPTCAVIPWGYA